MGNDIGNQQNQLIQNQIDINSIQNQDKKQQKMSYSMHHSPQFQEQISYRNYPNQFQENYQVKENIPINDTFQNYQNNQNYQNYPKNQQIQEEFIIFKIANTSKFALAKPTQKYDFDIEQRVHFNNPHLLKTYGIKHEENFIYFESLDQNLKSMIVNRVKNQLFTESDIIILTKSITCALAYLQTHNVFHGDICTENIFFCPIEGCFKIYDNEVFNGRGIAFQKTRKGQQQGLLPPELIMPSQDPKIEFLKENFHKVTFFTQADVFALGLVMLEAMTLQASESLYDPQTKFINANEINNRIQYASQYYAPELCHIVRIFVALDCNLRPDSIQAYKTITQKENWDNTKKQFKNYGQVQKNQILCKKQMLSEEENLKQQQQNINQYDQQYKNYIQQMNPKNQQSNSANNSSQKQINKDLQHQQIQMNLQNQDINQYNIPQQNEQLVKFQMKNNQNQNFLNQKYSQQQQGYQEQKPNFDQQLEKSSKSALEIPQNYPQYTTQQQAQNFYNDPYKKSNNKLISHSVNVAEQIYKNTQQDQSYLQQTSQKNNMETSQHQRTILQNSYQQNSQQLANVPQFQPQQYLQINPQQFQKNQTENIRLEEQYNYNQFKPQIQTQNISQTQQKNYQDPSTPQKRSVNYLQQNINIQQSEIQVRQQHRQQIKQSSNQEIQQQHQQHIFSNQINNQIHIYPSEIKPANQYPTQQANFPRQPMKNNFLQPQVEKKNTIEQKDNLEQQIEKMKNQYNFQLDLPYTRQLNQQLQIENQKKISNNFDQESSLSKRQSLQSTIEKIKEELQSTKQLIEMYQQKNE